MLLAFSFTPFLLAFYILITWGVCAAVLVGIGSLLLHPLVANHRPLDAFWAGLFLAVSFLQLAHFFVPIAWPFPVLFCVLGLVGLLLHGRSYFPSSVSAAPARPHPSSLLWSLFLTAALALRCVGPCDHYDTGFYGAMAVRWFNTYPLVPGLANLMAELGFNSSVFLCVAALNHGPWNGLAFHLFPAMLLSALAFSVVPAFCRIWRGQKATAADAFLSVLIIPSLFWVTNSEIIGTNTDLPTTFVALIAFHYLIVALQSPDDTNYSAESAAVPLLLAALLFALAVSFKISSAVFAFFGWSWAVAQIWKLELSPQHRRNLLRAAVILPAALVLTWSLRGIVISGYPFFPSSFLGMPFEWRVPRRWVDFQALGVRSWARIPWASLSETEVWRWVARWFHPVARNRVDFIFPAVFSFAGIITLVWRAELRRARWLRALLPAAVALIFWFWGAPALRFGEFVIWSIAATLGAAAILGTLPILGKNARRAMLLGFVAIAIWCSHPRTIWRAFYRPAFEQRELPKLHEVPVAPYKVDGNLTILVPFKKNQCWDAPLPCSPYFFDSLRLRRDSNLRSGFSDRENLGNVDKSGEFHKLYWTGPEPEPDQ